MIAHFKALFLFSAGRRLALTSLGFVLIALLCFFPADIALYASEPWAELALIGRGFITPFWQNPIELLQALGQTIAFALLALIISIPLGLLMAVFFHWRLLRLLAAAVRSVHEIFWGLLFMQVYGLSATTGLLAILIPYSGVFAKVFAEILSRQSPWPEQTIAPSTARIVRYSYSRIAQAMDELRSYSRYRFECALRSSAILGFIGLPTLGFHLETAFKQGQYSEAAAVLWLFFLLIASIRFWLKPILIPLYTLLALWLLPQTPQLLSLPGGESLLWRFISEDIWPQALRDGDMVAALSWYGRQFSELAWPAILQTLYLTQIALVLTAVVALVSYPWASAALTPRGLRLPGRAVLLLLRSTPDMMIAFILLLLLGPSGLPAVIALALHNGGLIAFLLANHSERLNHRRDESRGFNRYLYSHTPRLYPGFLAFLLYRWEVILRESAIMGILGIATLGFYIDSAFEEIRYHQAFFLIVVAAVLNMLVDALSRRAQRFAGAQPLKSV